MNTARTIGIVLCWTLQAQSPPERPPASREDLFASEQAEKAKVLRPPKQAQAEVWAERVQRLFLGEPAGFYPYFAEAYQGGSLTGGAGYRRFYGDNGYWAVQGLYSIRNYKLLEAWTVSRDHWNRKLAFGSRFLWRDATQVNFYGLGQGSSEEDRTDFRFQQTYVDGNLAFRPRRWMPITGSVGVEHWNSRPGTASETPSIETVYTPQTAPGLGIDPTYVHSMVGAGIDWRQSPGYTRRGGLYAATIHDFRNIGGGVSSFQRLDAEAVQHIPLLRETWVLAGRAKVETILNDNDLVPYFLLPSLGGGSTLRAYMTDRFRDRHSLLTTAEFRWIPNPGLDMALFYDAGKVASHRSDLDFKSMKSDIGFGVRLHGRDTTPFRVEVAVGNEGWRFILSSGPVF